MERDVRYCPSGFQGRVEIGGEVVQIDECSHRSSPSAAEKELGSGASAFRTKSIRRSVNVSVVARETWEHVSSQKVPLTQKSLQ